MTALLTTASPVAPLENLFNLAINGSNAAQAMVLAPSNFDSLAAITGMVSPTVALMGDSGVSMVYNGVKWVQFGVATFATASARDAAYARASGAYKVNLVQSQIATERFTRYYSTASSSWKPFGTGLFPVNPASVSGSGVTLNADGSISVAGSITASINGCFTADFTNYRILVEASSSSSADVMAMRLRSAGSDFAGSAAHIYSITETSSGGASTGASSSSAGTNSARIGRIGSGAGGGGSYAFDLYGPNTSRAVKRYLTKGYDSDGISDDGGGGITTSSQCDGISIGLGANTWSGQIWIEGYCIG